MAWTDPIVGGTALRIPAIQSPNYLAGSLGWTINVDGSAEFNNLTVRGTFVGTDYIINSAGAFFYSGTPAAGNLVTSIAANPGTDSFGNPYPAGVNTQSGAVAADQFANMDQGNLFLGALGAGASPDLTNAAQIFPSPTLAQLAIRSGITVGSPDPAFVQVWGGKGSHATGSGTNPFVQLNDLASTSAVDLLLSGSVISTAVGGGANLWQTPSYNAGWAGGAVGGGFQPLQYRFDAENNLVFSGAMHTTSATPSTFAFTLPAAYRPAANQRVGTVGLVTGTNTVVAGYFQVGSNGSTGFFTPAAGNSTTNTDVYVSHAFPLGNIS